MKQIRTTDNVRAPKKVSIVTFLAMLIWSVTITWTGNRTNARSVSILMTLMPCQKAICIAVSCVPPDE